MNIDGNRMYIAYMDNPRLYGTGIVIQHLHYLPFGEDWVDQRNSSWNTPYTFSGKEKDVETGYGYFGARYYDSGLSIWLSVDPMSDKYPSMSPYNYCANNPVILVDPNGLEFVDNEGGPDDPMGRGDGPAPNQTNSNTLPPLSSVFPGLRPKEKNFSLKQNQSASPSGNTTTTTTSPSQQSSSTTQSESTTTTPTAPNSNGQAKNPAHSVTIGGVLSITRGLSLVIGPIWDKDGGELLICFGVCRGLDLSGGLTYSNCNSMDAAEGKGEALVSSISLVDGGLIPYVGWLLGVSLSPLPAGFTLRKTYTLILKPDPAEYGDNISKCGHPIR